MKLYLAGPKAGKTIVLNGLSFVSGIAEVDPKNTAIANYFGKCYAAYPEGSDELAAALSLPGGGKEIYYGKRDIPQNESRTKSGSASDGTGTPTAASEDQRSDDAADTHAQGSGSGTEGGGHEDAGLRIQETVVEACMKLDTINPKHWSPGGVPKFPEVLNRLGANELGITRKQINTYGLTRTQVAERQDA
jgi:hypothetical protein